MLFAGPDSDEKSCTKNLHAALPILCFKRKELTTNIFTSHVRRQFLPIFWNQAGNRVRGWRLSTEVQGFPGFRAPTWTAARRKNNAGVGASLRKFKAFRAFGRQLERPRVGKTTPGLAPLYGRSRLSRLPGANLDGRASEKQRRGWRLSTEVQGFPGFRAPTRTAARRKNNAGVGASQRKFKAFRAFGRQLERPRAGPRLTRVFLYIESPQIQSLNLWAFSF